MIRYLRQHDDEGDDEWDLHEPELSWHIWVLLEATEWRFLPFSGSLLEQPDWLLDDLATIAAQRRAIEARDEAKGGEGIPTL